MRAPIALALALVACPRGEEPLPPPPADDAAPALPELVHRLSPDELRGVAAQVLGVDVPTDAFLPAVTAFRDFEHLDESTVDLEAWVDGLEGWGRAVLAARRVSVPPAPQVVSIRGPDLTWDAGQLGIDPRWSFTVFQLTGVPTSATFDLPAAGDWTLLVSWTRASPSGALDVDLVVDGAVAVRWDGAFDQVERASDELVLSLAAGTHTVALVPDPAREAPLAPSAGPAWFQDPGPWVGLDHLVFTLPAAGPARPPLPGWVSCADDDRACVEAGVASLALGLWRRPATAEELGALMGVVDAARADGGDLDAAIDDAALAMMLSPSFAFLIADGSAWERASRLSLALWQQGPDEELRGCAARGELGADGPCAVAAQAQRLLADPRSDALITSFVERWLGVHTITRLGFITHQQPRWTPELVADLQAEVANVARAARSEGRDLRSVLTDPRSLATGRVAQLYGLPAGSLLTPHALDRSAVGRVGLLGLGGVQLAWAKGSEPSVVDPAVWVLARLLCRTPPPPPPNVPPLVPDADPLAQMSAHLNDFTCSGCHLSIDPYGLPLTGFDAIGAARAEAPAPSTLPEGAEIADLASYGAWLAAQPEVATCAAEHVAAWAWRRAVRSEDADRVDQIVAAAEAGGFTLDALFAAALDDALGAP